MRPVLCLVTDRACAHLALEGAVAEAVEGGVDWIQVRERELEGRALLAHVERIAAAAREAAPHPGAIRVLVNRRADVALALGADGVHLGFDALRPASARRLLAPAMLLGVSAHSAEEVFAAAAAGADYAQLAPIYPPLSKAGSRAALGLEPLRRAAQAGIPVLAQGGVEPRRVGELLAAGAAGVAVTGSLLMTDQPGRAAAALRRALDVGAQTAGPADRWEGSCDAPR